MNGQIPVYHVITPGDHFSPRTGSALPTVVDALARASIGDARFRQYVLVQEGTWRPRYESAEVIEYAGGPPPTRRQRAIDALAGRTGLARPFAGRAYAPIAQRLASCAPGIVVAHNGPALLRMPGLASHARVLYAHNDLFRSYGRAECDRVVAAGDRVICVSEYLRGVMAQRVRVGLRSRFRSVLNGADIERFTPNRKRRDGPLRVAFVGRVIPDKGVDVLVDAANRLDRNDMEILVIGSQGFDRGSPLSDYEQQLRASAVPAVRFEPFMDREALPRLLRDQDVLVVPSRWPEPCGLTVGEAMASGLAVIGSRSGGIPEALGDAGILVSPGDADALARTLERFADSPAQAREMGRRARHQAVSYDWTHAWARLAEILEELR